MLCARTCRRNSSASLAGATPNVRCSSSMAVPPALPSPFLIPLTKPSIYGDGISLCPVCSPPISFSFYRNGRVFVATFSFSLYRRDRDRCGLWLYNWFRRGRFGFDHTFDRNGAIFLFLRDLHFFLSVFGGSKSLWGRRTGFRHGIASGDLGYMRRAFRSTGITRHSIRKHRF